MRVLFHIILYLFFSQVSHSLLRNTPDVYRLRMVFSVSREAKQFHPSNDSTVASFPSSLPFPCLLHLAVQLPTTTTSDSLHRALHQRPPFTFVSCARMRQPPALPTSLFSFVLLVLRHLDLLIHQVQAKDVSSSSSLSLSLSLLFPAQRLTPSQNAC